MPLPNGSRCRPSAERPLGITENTSANKNPPRPSISAKKTPTPKSAPSPPATAPVANDPGKRPSSERNSADPAKSANSNNGKISPHIDVPVSSAPPAPRQSSRGAGKGSPRTTLIMRTTPAEIPAAGLPVRKSGMMVSSMMRREVRSVSAPSSPRPTSIRIPRSSIATSNNAPSSTPLRPSCHASTTRIAYCSMVSGCVVATVNTASCAPVSASKSLSVLSSAARSSAESTPAPSVTRACKTGMGCKPSPCASAMPDPANSTHADSAHTDRAVTDRVGVLAHRLTMSRAPQPPSLVAKSTVGGAAMAASFSTLKFALVSKPNTLAVRLEGNCRTVTL